MLMFVLLLFSWKPSIRRIYKQDLCSPEYMYMFSQISTPSDFYQQVAECRGMILMLILKELRISICF